MLALFDIDGTLLSAGGAGSRALSEVFHRRFGVPEVMRTIRCAGKTDLSIVAEMFVTGLGRSPSQDECLALLQEYEQLLPLVLAEADGFSVFPGVPRALDALEGELGALLGIATGNTRGGALAKLRHGGIDRRFAIGGYGCDDVDRARLVARAIERATGHAGRPFAGEQVVVIGDTPRDVSAAHSCGARCVAVTTGPYDREALDAAGADAVIGDLAELPDLLRQDW